MAEPRSFTWLTCKKKYKLFLIINLKIQVDYWFLRARKDLSFMYIRCFFHHVCVLLSVIVYSHVCTVLITHNTATDKDMSMIFKLKKPGIPPSFPPPPPHLSLPPSLILHPPSRHQPSSLFCDLIFTEESWRVEGEGGGGGGRTGWHSNQVRYLTMSLRT